MQATHSELPPAADTRCADVAGMFSGIARFYDPLNHLLSFGIDRHWRDVLAASVVPGTGGVVLDLAAGTLDVSLAVRKSHKNALVAGLDFCLPMLRQGARKLKGDNALRILPVAADAKRLPVASASVDCITMAFGIRNITPRARVFGEMLRVLKPGGRACILEFGSGRERIWHGLYNFYLNSILPKIGSLFSHDGAYAYLADTIRGFPTAPELEAEMREAGFASVRCRRLTSGIAYLHVGET